MNARASLFRPVSLLNQNCVGWDIWDLISRTESWERRKGTKKKTCVQRIGIIKKTKGFRMACMRTFTNKVSHMGVVPGGVWRSKAQGMASSKRENMRRQLARAAGMKPPFSFSFFWDVNNLEVEHERLVQRRVLGHKQFGQGNGMTEAWRPGQRSQDQRVQSCVK